MPEEEAFAVFVRIMFQYHIRELFKPGFELLTLRFFQVLSPPVHVPAAPPR